MRKAAALDDDFGYDAPAPRKAARKPRAVASGRKKKGKRFDWDHVARYGAIAISATVAVGIMVNALLMQKGHHPAPLFAQSLVPQSDVAKAAATPPVGLKAAPTTAAAAGSQLEAAAPGGAANVGAANVGAASVGASKARRPASAHDDTEVPSGDPIARLLNGPKAPVSAAERGDGKTTLAVQKALIKLGFAVKANGAMSPATRKAIEAFEKDRHLPVKGELSRRLVKVLAAESGVHMD